ncbi:MAG: response regulator [Blastocatellia bacterium]
MSRRGRVLVVDDEDRWRDLLGSTLRAGGFEADTAGAVEEALERLATGFYHLLVVDIRMVHNDPANTGGMSLLRELEESGLLGASEVIMLSAYGTLQQMREAFARHKVADFLSKEDFDNIEFLDLVRKTFQEKVRVNPDLIIHWEQSHGPEEMMVNLRLGEERVKRDSPRLARLALELEDLLCRLFVRAESLMIKPLTQGHSGSAVLLATPFYADSGAGQPVVVKFGDVGEIDAEYQNFKAYVQNFIGGTRSTSVIDLRRTPHLGGIVYSMLGSGGERLESFEKFYARSDIGEIKELLNRLFLETCGPWYANPGRLQPRDLAAEYERLLNLTQVNLQHAIAQGLKSVQGKNRLHLNDLPGERTFANPVLVVGNQRFIKPTYVCTTHGDLNENNILVDELRHAWLIDFRRTGSGHILRDVAELDTIIRIQLLNHEDASLEERLEMEDVLCSAAHFSEVAELEERFPTKNEAIAKAYAIAIHLRLIAYKLVERNPSDDIGEYYIALLYNALGYTRFLSLPNMQRQHALISASLMADRIGV